MQLEQEAPLLLPPQEVLVQLEQRVQPMQVPLVQREPVVLAAAPQSVPSELVLKLVLRVRLLGLSARPVIPSKQASTRPVFPGSPPSPVQAEGAEPRATLALERLLSRRACQPTEWAPRRRGKFPGSRAFPAAPHAAPATRNPAPSSATILKLSATERGDARRPCSASAQTPTPLAPARTSPPRSARRLPRRRFSAQGRSSWFRGRRHELRHRFSAHLPALAPLLAPTPPRPGRPPAGCGRRAPAATSTPLPAPASAPLRHRCAAPVPTLTPAPAQTPPPMRPAERAAAAQRDGGGEAYRQRSPSRV